MFTFSDCTTTTPEPSFPTDNPIRLAEALAFVRCDTLHFLSSAKCGSKAVWDLELVQHGPPSFQHPEAHSRLEVSTQTSLLCLQFDCEA